MALTVNFTGAASLSTETNPTNVVTDVGQGIPYGLQPKLGIMKSRVDTSKTGGTNTNSDVYEAILIPAGYCVLSAWFVTVSAESTNTTATMSLGIGGDVDEFVAATAPDTDDEIFPMDGDALALNGSYCATADTIDLKVATAAFTDAIVDVYALVLDMNP